MEKAKILIVEDEAIIAMEIENQLQSLGYEETSIVDTSEKAIEKAEEDKPDLILMDIRIKGEMDGIDTAEEIRNKFGIPVIFSTAYLDEERIERAKITMPFGYVLKPIQKRDLKVTLEMALYVSKADTERRKAELEVNTQVDFLDNIMEQSPFAMWISDTTGTVIKTNRVLRESLNLTDQQIIGHYNVLEDENLEVQGVMPQVKSVFTLLKTAKFNIPWFSAKAGNVDFKNAQDLWIDVTIFPIVDKKGNLLNVVCQWIDITGRKQMETTLRESEKRFRRIIQDTEAGYFFIYKDGIIKDVNEAWAKMYKYSSPDEIIGKHFAIVQKIDDLEMAKEFVGGIMQGNPDYMAGEFSRLCKDGSIGYHTFSANPVVQSGEVIGIEGFIIDSTERKNAEEALINSHNELKIKVQEQTEEYKIAKEEAEQANKLKSEFLANISHELRNPMHQILSYSKYGLDKIDKPKEKLWHYFNQTRKAAERLMVLLNDLLDLSKMESGRMDYKMEPNNVFRTTNEAVSELIPAIEEKGLSLNVIDPSVPTKIICDYYKIGQVIRNLLTNAIKFTPVKKSIEICFKKNELINQNISVPAIQVSVRDQGVGIPEDELALIFDKFIQSTKTKTGAGGTGLGLSICYEIIKAHGGKIWAENNPEGGTTFSFMLPYQQEIA